LQFRESELERRENRLEDQIRRMQQERAEMEHEVRILQAQIDAAFDKNTKLVA
jgi:chaperonin cofactor prefoldin